MKPTLKEPKQFFNVNVPLAIREEFVRTIFRGYKDAYTDIVNADYPDEQIHDLYPYVRRCRIDDYLYQFSNKFSEISTHVERNIAQNTHHTILIVGNVVLTASAVDNPTELPREAQFRNLYAGAQLDFTIDPDNILRIMNTLPPPDSRLYAIILHGPISRRNRITPGFIRIVFPNRDCSEQLDHIDLFQQCSTIVQEMSEYGMEVVEDKAEVKLRSNVRSQGRLL